MQNVSAKEMIRFTYFGHQLVLQVDDKHRVLWTELISVISTCNIKSEPPLWRNKSCLNEALARLSQS